MGYQGIGTYYGIVPDRNTFEYSAAGSNPYMVSDIDWSGIVDTETCVGVIYGMRIACTNNQVKGKLTIFAHDYSGSIFLCTEMNCVVEGGVISYFNKDVISFKPERTIRSDYNIVTENDSAIIAYDSDLSVVKQWILSYNDLVVPAPEVFPNLCTTEVFDFYTAGNVIMIKSDDSASEFAD